MDRPCLVVLALPPTITLEDTAFVLSAGDGSVRRGCLGRTGRGRSSAGVTARGRFGSRSAADCEADCAADCEAAERTNMKRTKVSS